MVPVKETDIALKREVLNMKMRGPTMHVNVHFEFYNPGDEKTLTVGFVNPPYEEGGETGDPGAEDFTAIKDGKELETEVAKIGDTEFQSALGEDMADKKDYVNYFEVTFDPGLNVIEHSYNYGGTTNAIGEHRLHYRLTTGKNWANGQIDDFTLNLDMGKAFFELTPHFQKGNKGIDWEVIGEGNVTEKRNRSDEKVALAYTTDNGYLSFQKKEFEPDQDLSIVQRAFSPKYKRLGTPGLHQAPAEEEDVFMEMWKLISKRGTSTEKKMEALKEYDASELRLLRNGFFAAHGYVFNDKELQRHFERYVWYIPDPELKPTANTLTEKQRKWVKRIKELEAK